jgi:hypothetical protein
LHALLPPEVVIVEGPAERKRGLPESTFPVASDRDRLAVGLGDVSLEVGPAMPAEVLLDQIDGDVVGP